MTPLDRWRLMMNIRGVDGIEKAVLGALAFHADAQMKCWPSMDLIAAETGFCRNAVRRARDRLAKKGLVTVSSSSGRHSTTYQLHLEPSTRGTVDAVEPSRRGTVEPSTRDTVQTPNPPPEGHEPSTSCAPTLHQRDPNQEGTWQEPGRGSLSSPDGEDVLCPDGRDRKIGAKVDMRVQIPSCPHEAIIAAYHEALPALPRVKIWTTDRRKLLASRWREDPQRQSVDWWRALFEHVAKSDFLCGRVQPKDDRAPFLATLEWLVRPKNFPKILEGNYDQRPAPRRHRELQL